MTIKEFRKKNREKRRVFSTQTLVVMGLMAIVFALMPFEIYIADLIPFKIHPFFEILCYSLLLVILFSIFDKGYRKTVMGFFKN